MARKPPKARYVGGTEMSVRDMFPILRARLLASRPVLETAHEVKHTHMRERFVYAHDKKTAELISRTRQIVKVVDIQRIPARYGKPTFKNAIIDGQHV